MEKKINPIKIIKQNEDQAQKIIQAAQELAKKNLNELIRQKEEEFKHKTEQAKTNNEEYLQKLQTEFDKQITAAIKKVVIKADMIKSKSTDRIVKATNFVVDKLINLSHGRS